jgi:NitT/TauT family transport system substrate-binding protein
MSKKPIKVTILFFICILIQTFAGVSFGEEKRIFFVQTSPANMILQLKSKDIDGFIAWEPFNAQAVKEGIGRYLIQSGEIWKDHPCCVLAVSNKLTDENVLRALVWAHVRATLLINDPRSKNKVLEYARQFTGKDAQVVEEALKHIKFITFPSPAEMKKYYQGLQEGRLIKKSAKELGFNDEEDFFRHFLNQKYYKEVESALQKDPQWQPESLPATTKVRMAYLLQDLHQLAIFIAQKEGFYEKVGLVPKQNMILGHYAHGVAVMEAFKVGEIDGAYLGGAPATLKRLNDDIKIRIVAGVNNEGSALVVRRDSSIKDLKGLAGKTVAIPAVGNVQYFLLKKIAEQAGYRLVLK